jgi:hypothetical protein
VVRRGQGQVGDRVQDVSEVGLKRRSERDVTDQIGSPLWADYGRLNTDGKQTMTNQFQS